MGIDIPKGMFPWVHLNNNMNTSTNHSSTAETVSTLMIHCIAQESKLGKSTSWRSLQQGADTQYQQMVDNVGLSAGTLTRFDLTVSSEHDIGDIEDMVNNSMKNLTYTIIKRRIGTDGIHSVTTVQQPPDEIGTSTALKPVQSFRFEYCRKAGDYTDLPKVGKFIVQMTQDVFDDHRKQLDAVHQALLNLGIPKSDCAHHFEDPLVSPELLNKLRALMGAKNEDCLIAYYAHSSHHNHFQVLMCDGREFKWKSFGYGGRFIKFAPSYPNPTPGEPGSL